jgi:hypothetical protein
MSDVSSNADVITEFAKSADFLALEVFEAGAVDITAEVIYHRLDAPLVLAEPYTHIEQEEHLPGWEELVEKIGALKKQARKPLLTAEEARKLGKEISELNEAITEYREQSEDMEDFTIPFSEIQDEAEKLIAIGTLPFPKLEEFLLDWHRNKGPMAEVSVSLSPPTTDLKEAFERAMERSEPQETIRPSGIIIPAPGSFEP